MNMYQVREIASGTNVTGALSYNEAVRYMQVNRLNTSEYEIVLYMPKRPANGIAGMQWTD